jgi:serine-type D-Ala-D-Ala carboxypeptidase/endopeptidase (penicillin-binding protein 4)
LRRNLRTFAAFRFLCAAPTLLAASIFIASSTSAQARAIPPLVMPRADGSPWTADERGALRTRLDDIVASSRGIRGSHVGLFAIDTRGGSLLYARQADDEFMPASTLKLLVGSVALARLGTEFRFHTEAFVTEPIVNSVENGDFVLRGGGDPFLGAADLDALAQAVAGAGITTLRGNTFSDSSYFDAQRYPPGWVWDDLPFYYAPVVSATSFEENVVRITATAGANVGDAASVTAEYLGPIRRVPIEGCAATHRVVVIPHATTGPAHSESTIDVTRLPGNCIQVVGSVPLGGSDSVDAAVPSPEAFLHDVLGKALHARGIEGGQGSMISGGAYPEDNLFYGLATIASKQKIWTHDSEALPKLLADMWYPSDNLLAELLLKSLGVAGSGVPGTTENGAKVERAWLQSIGVDPRTVTLSDGSGLSIYDRITPRDLVSILQADWNGPDRQIVLDALPVAGVRGTLREEFVDSAAAGRAFVKTGSMSHVRGLAGYLQTRHHGALTFALMVDDWNGDAAALNAFRSAVLTALLGT